MKARYLDLPVEKLHHRLLFPEMWESMCRGKTLTIDPRPLHPDEINWGPLSYATCSEPYYLRTDMKHPVENGEWVVSSCLIELDESALDGEVTRVYEELQLEEAMKK